MRICSVEGCQGGYCARGLCRHHYKLAYKEHIRECYKIYSQRPEVKERKNAYNKIYYQEHKEDKKKYYQEHKEHRSACCKAWYRLNREKRIRQEREWGQRPENKRRKLDAIKRWYKTPKGKACRNRWYKTPKGRASRMRTDNKRNHKFPVELTKHQMEQIKQRDGMKCIYCGKDVFEYPNVPNRHPQQLTFDHVNPNGGTTMDNMVIACRWCNASKNSRNVFEWCKEKGYRVPLVAMVVMRNGE